MKKLIILIIVLLISISGFAQQYFLVINDSIVRSGLPVSHTSNDGQYWFKNYQSAPESVHYADGFRPGVIPQFNPDTQYLGEKYFDHQLDHVTWQIIDKSEAQLNAEIDARLKAENDKLDIQSIKKVLRQITDPILNSDSVTQDELNSYVTLYDVFDGRGVRYELGEIVKYDSTLWEVISPHNSQLDWTPDVAVSLFVKKQVKQANEILPWDYPVAYKLNEKVTYNGFTYICIQPHTSQAGWTPATVASLWTQLIE